MKLYVRQMAAFAVAFGCLTAPAEAHSKKEATQPADGAVLAMAPDLIGMTFTMPLRVTLVSLTDQTGTEHALTRNDNMQPVKNFTAEPDDLPPGEYKVDWRGLAGDGHPMQGAFSFEISD
ncbi:copper resistance CopC family protein [Roseobacter sp. GAI101]|uniref:copper resistance CopC family protein n=1 Tax=Roseobacter sp. (strain GAI101) TaxID=391589 RepID=UPI0001871722|nr:copper resistance CopC family protein [Roseobacter sp. GAI101]EEB84276.1 Copper resistance protein CopC [Roseobacter sp. GAI101]